MIDKFQEEQNKLLQILLDTYFNKWEDQSNKNKNGLELFITPVCNQECSYCYIAKYGNELYPKEIRDTKTILNNLNFILQYILDNKFKLPRLDLFSGEI